MNKSPDAVISTWIYLDSPDERSVYPQVGKHSHLPAFQMVYWQCVAVFFALSKRNNPQSRHILFTNQQIDQLPVYKSFRWFEYLQKLDVEVVTLPLSWQTPAGYYGRWRNQFYIFDILKFFEKQVYDDDLPLLVFDSDCLINRPLDSLFEAIRQKGLMALPIVDHPPEDNINGINRLDMRDLFAELDGGKDPGFVPVYYGGEIFAGTPSIVRRINLIIPPVWHVMMQRHHNGEKKFNEEAHFLSYAYFKIGQFGNLESYIRRIWTSTRYNDVKGGDINLPIWHLPSEKTGGIAILFDRLRSEMDLPHDPVLLGRIVGLPNRAIYRNTRHLLKYTSLYRWWLKLSGG